MEKSNWAKDLLDGKIYCPFRKCSTKFPSPIQLALHLVSGCSQGKFTGKIPCLFCPKQVPVDENVHHQRRIHRDIATVILSLLKNIPKECPNYRCKKTFNDLHKYILHARTCQPLYKCEKCDTCLSAWNNYLQHDRRCTGIQGIAINRTKVQIPVNELRKRKKLTDTGLKKHLSAWKTSFSTGSLSCPIPGCKELLATPRLYNMHLKAELQSNKDFFNDIKVNCHFCGASTYILDFRFHIASNHKDLYKAFLDIEKNGKLKCPNSRCKMKFSLKNGSQYFMHSINCRPLFECYICGQTWISNVEKQSTAHMLNLHNIVLDEKTDKKMMILKKETKVSSSSKLKMEMSVDVSGRATIQSLSDYEGPERPTIGVPVRHKTSKLKAIKQVRRSHKTTSTKQYPRNLQDFSDDDDYDDDGDDHDPKSISDIQSMLSKDEDTCISLKQKSVSSNKGHVRHIGLPRGSYNRKNKIGVGSGSVRTHNQCEDILHDKIDDKRIHKASREFHRNKQLKKAIANGQMKKSSKYPPNGLEESCTMTQCPDKKSAKVKNFSLYRLSEVEPITYTKNKLCKKTKARPRGRPSKRNLPALQFDEDSMYQADFDSSTEAVAIAGSSDVIEGRNSIFPNSISSVDSLSPADSYGHEKSVHDSSMMRMKGIKSIIADWYSALKGGNLQCPFPDCPETFHKPKLFIHHMMLFSLEDRLRKVIFDENTLPCCFCDEDIAIPVYNNHFIKEHAQEMKPILNNESLTCHRCEQVSENNKAYLRHVSDCYKKQELEKKEEERKKGKREQWDADIKKGIFRCGNEDCEKKFVFWNDLLDHIRRCDRNDSNKYILQVNQIKCPFCDVSTMLKFYNNHMMTMHQPIYDQLFNEESTISCPNFNCNKSFEDGISFLQHCVLCPTCLLCYDCKRTFTDGQRYQQHECLANDEIFIKKTLDMWYNEIKSGQLCCANPSCNSWFYIPDEFISHLRKCEIKSLFCRRILKENKIPCAFCSKTVQLSDFAAHISDHHPDINEELLQLSEGKSIRCLNYKCNNLFTEGIKFFHHAVLCKPLFHCSKCNSEFSTKANKLNHMCRPIECVGLDGKKTIETSHPTSSKKHNVDVKFWYDKTKSAIFDCPDKTCGQSFRMYDMLLNHINKCRKPPKYICKKILQINQIGCCLCEKLVRLNSFDKHVKDSHPMVHLQLQNIASKGDAICQNGSCKMKFTDRRTYFVHAMDCQQTLRCDSCCSQYTTMKGLALHQCAIKKTLQNWSNEIIHGILVCPNVECLESFSSLDKFIEHLKYCSKGDLSQLVRQDGYLPCLICKSNFPISSLVQHFRVHHTVVFAQLRLIEQGLCIHCPNYKCKMAFADASKYLRHAATQCKPLMFCDRCKAEFPNEKRFKRHTCHIVVEEEEPQLWGKISRNLWYDRIMTGNLRCPNSRCGVEFVLPRDFVRHLKECKDGEECMTVLKEKKLPCCFCKKYILLSKYCSHLSSCHKEKGEKALESRGVVLKELNFCLLTPFLRMYIFRNRKAFLLSTHLLEF